MSNAAAQSPGDPIAAGFRTVPMEARMRLFWRIFGPAWDRAEIDYQLDQLQQAGVGGVMTCFTYPVALDDPARGIRNQAFLSPEFLETLRYAAEKARQLGLEFAVCGGTGWPYGGPGVSLHDAAQHLRMESGQPLPNGQGYRLPKLRLEERYMAVFCGSQEVTTAVRGDRLEATAPGPCRVFIAGPTYMRVKRPALGGEGYVIDHYSREATQRYLDTVVAPLLRSAPPGTLRTLFCDSLEVYNANWTHDFPMQFRKRRGYDLIPHLPELFDDQAPAAPDLRFDFWRTAAELAEQEFARTVHAWCRQHGVAFALEAYGTPPMGLTAAGACDVPWGEQYEWKGFSFSRFATSGGHLAGKKILGAEAWTWAGIPNRLADSLSDLKLCSDLHFLSGENELTGVDFPYSPRAAGVPGWLPYYGPVINQNNPQWSVFPALAAYINRCQWLLRQGEPVADVALYVPTEDAFAQGATNQMLLDFQLRDRLTTGPLTEEFGLARALQHRSDVIATLLAHGYNFDGIDFFAMNALAHVQGSRLIAGDGHYSVLVLPNLAGMDLAALEKAARFCRAGGTVIATRRLPDRVYGRRSAQDTKRLRALMAAMFGTEATQTGAQADGSERTGTGDAAVGLGREAAAGVRMHPYGQGKAIFTDDERAGLAAALAQAAAPPDLRVSPLQPDVSHVHRRVGERDFYFVANVGAAPARFMADFRVAGKEATLWDPLQGTITHLPLAGQDQGRTRILLNLPPRGSAFVCFAPAMARTLPEAASSDLLRARPLDIAWRITFDGPDAPPSYETRALTSWTDWPNARFFSGRATYTGTFTAPAVTPKRALLRFTGVREAAEIVVNGRRAGAVWTPPYELEITAELQPGPNTLQITVANLLVNRVLGLPDPDLRALRAAYGDRFPDPEEKRLMPAPAPSGLLGPVFLLTPDDRPGPM